VELLRALVIVVWWGAMTGTKKRRIRPMFSLMAPPASIVKQSTWAYGVIVRGQFAIEASASPHLMGCLKDIYKASSP